MSDGLESRVLDLQSPPASCDTSGSSSGSVSKKNRALRSQHASDESSGSAEKKQRVIVDLDDIDSEPDDDEAGKDTEQEMVQVKIEPEE